MGEDEVQGVLSVIEFPLGKDELAVSQAFHQLLKEGWEFIGFKKDSVSLMRKWEVDLSKIPNLSVLPNPL